MNIQSDQYVDKLKALVGVRDPEFAHEEADDILCDLLKKLGYDDVVNAWDEVDKWYA